MSFKRNQWFNRYYVIIVIFCLMLGLFIWFLFGMMLSGLEDKNQDAMHKNGKALTMTSPKAIA